MTASLPYFRGRQLLTAEGAPVAAPPGVHPLRTLGVGARFVDHRGVTMQITDIRVDVDAAGHGCQIIVARSV